jgi:transglutaminase-like putative cysteine protease
MDEQLIETTLREWTNGLDKQAARIRVFERVRDLPYSYPSSRDPVEVLRGGRGSCSGKHYLLGEFFRRLGMNVRHMVCTHRFNESPIGFPEELQAMLRKNEIVDVHDYLQIRVGDEWIDVDATWPLALRDFGFPVNEDWDGRSPMLLSVVPEETVVVTGDPEKKKEEILARFTPRQRQLRKQFLEALSRWVNEITSDTGR